MEGIKKEKKKKKKKKKKINSTSFNILFQIFAHISYFI